MRSLQARSLEQAYSSYAKPHCYKGTPISISHGKWVPGYFHQHGGQQVSWVDKQGTPGSADSINKASMMLDVAPTTLKKHANCLIDNYLDSPTLGEVKVQGLPYVNSPRDRVVEFNNLDLDTSDLLVNKVFVYDGGLNKLEHLGPYDTVKQAIKPLGLGWQKKFYTMLNKDALLYVHGLATSVYLVSNRVSKSNAAVVHNITSGESKEFESMTSAIASVTPEMVTVLFLRQYVLKRKEFMSTDGNTYLVEFKEESDHIATAERIKKEQQEQTRKGNLKRSARRLEAKQRSADTDTTHLYNPHSQNYISDFKTPDT